MADPLPPTTVTVDVPATLTLNFKAGDEKRTMPATDEHLAAMGYVKRDHIARLHRQVLNAILGVSSTDELTGAGQTLAYALNCTVDYDGPLAIAYDQNAIDRAMRGEAEEDDPEQAELVALRKLLVEEKR